MPPAGQLALGLLLILIVAAGAAAAVALLTVPGPADAPVVVSLADIDDVIAGCIRLTREQA